MRKVRFLLPFLLAAALMLLAACGEEGSAPAGNDTTGSDAPPEPAAGLFAPYYEIMADGVYTLVTEGEVAYTDAPVLARITRVADGDRLRLTTVAEDWTIDNVLIDGDTTYVLDDTARLARRASLDSATLAAYERNGLCPADSTVVATGEEAVDGTTYAYEDYTLADGGSLRVYFDGAVWVYARTDGDLSSLTRIVECNDTLPDGSFDIPSGYTVE